MFKQLTNLASHLLFTVLLLSNVSCLSFDYKPEATKTFSSDVAVLSYNVDSEEIYFDRREEEYIETYKGVPLYTQQPSLPNSCGPTAGAIIVGFYDRYYEDLIPNFTSYYPATGLYKSADRTYIPVLQNDLYVEMKTNVADVGVNETDCLNGLKQYVNKKNRAIQYSSVKSGSSINESSYINALNANHPVILFNNSTDVYMFGYASDHDIFVKSTIDGNHIYVAYGLYRVKYYRNNGNVRTDTYLRVACGLSLLDDGFIRISSTEVSVSNQWLNSAYAVAIS